MATVLDEILESFFQKLSEADAVDEATVARLRELFQSRKKLKADDFVAAIEKGAEEARG